MKYLIITATAGNGHNSTAKRIRESLLARDPSCEIKTVDAFKQFSGRWNAWLINEAYFLACDYAVLIYNAIFKKKEKTDYRAKTSDKAVMQGYSVLSGILNEIYSFKPDVIISTYVFCTVALSNLKRVYPIPAKICSMTLDYGISPYWERCSYGVDVMFLTTEEMKAAFIEKGFSEKGLIATGIPVSEQFGKTPKAEARAKLGLSPDKFTLVIMKASFFPVPDEKIVSQLRKLNADVQVVIINGNEKQRKRIEKLIRRKSCPCDIRNLGYTDEVPLYFSAADLIFGKGGGLTVTEIVNAGKPALIAPRLPQQEIYNKNYLVKNGCAVDVKDNEIAKTVNALKNGTFLGATLAGMERNALSLRRPDALARICETLERLPVADYSDVKINDSHKTIKRKVNEAVKKSVKEHKTDKRLG